jgi:CubicO group peptidase (beta-lactamase class C family)
MSKRKIAAIVAGIILVGGVLGWMFTAPYLGNTGLARTPGIILGGTPAPSNIDYSQFNGVVQGPLLMKQAGFPPFVNYLSWVGTPDGVITATRPDGGRWAQRVRDRGGDGWLRIGDSTFAMEAIEKFGDERLAMMAQWAAKARRPLDEPLYPGSEPLRDWEVFFWVPRP